MKKDKWFIKGYKEALKDVKDLIEFLEISLIRKKEKNGLEEDWIRKHWEVEE